jgi:hypothetical protein
VRRETTRAGRCAAERTRFELRHPSAPPPGGKGLGASLLEAPIDEYRQARCARIHVVVPRAAVVEKPKKARCSRSHVVKRDSKRRTLQPLDGVVRRKPAGAGLGGVPSMNRNQEVEVLWEDRSQKSQAKHKAQVVRPRPKAVPSHSCGLTDRNRVEGVLRQGERAPNREALATKDGGRRPGNRAAKETILTWGGLASRLKGRRRVTEREVSRGRSSGPRSRAGCARTSEVSDGVKDRTERRAKRP